MDVDILGVLCNWVGYISKGDTDLLDTELTYNKQAAVLNRNMVYVTSCGCTGSVGRSVGRGLTRFGRTKLQEQRVGHRGAAVSPTRAASGKGCLRVATCNKGQLLSESVLEQFLDILTALPRAPRALSRRISFGGNNRREGGRRVVKDALQSFSQFCLFHPLLPALLALSNPEG